MPRTWVRSPVVMTLPTCRRAQVERLASYSAMRMYTSSRGMRSGTCSGCTAGFGVAISVRLTGLSRPAWRSTMPDVSLFELLFALLLVCVLTGVAAVAVLAWSLVRRADGQAVAVAELRRRLETGGLTQESQASEMRDRLAQTQSVVERLGSPLARRPPDQDDAPPTPKPPQTLLPTHPTPPTSRP